MLKAKLALDSEVIATRPDGLWVRKCKATMTELPIDLEVSPNNPSNVPICPEKQT